MEPMSKTNLWNKKLTSSFSNITIITRSGTRNNNSNNSRGRDRDRGRRRRLLLVLLTLLIHSATNMDLAAGMISILKTPLKDHVIMDTKSNRRSCQSFSSVKPDLQDSDLAGITTP